MTQDGKPVLRVGPNFRGPRWETNTASYFWGVLGVVDRGAFVRRQLLGGFRWKDQGGLSPIWELLRRSGPRIKRD
eukprot:2579796-Pyramimonas_sp.AAC.1